MFGRFVHFRVRTWLFLLGVLVGPAFASAAMSMPAPKKVLFASASWSAAEFEEVVKLAKRAGATHVDVSVELPRSRWEYDTPGDPYPAWAVLFPSLFKLVPPAPLRAHINADYAERAMAELEARCAVVRRHGMKAYFSGGEPHMLPESVYREHPEWRGPRVDMPMRSAVWRYAPDIDEPEVLALYREAAATLLRRCPEIELLLLWTNDSGAGLSWSPGLYAGPNGKARHQRRPMAERIRDFYDALQQGARDAGGSLEVGMWMVREPDVLAVARELRGGTAVNNTEGPDATAFSGPDDYYLWWWWDDFAYPVIGIPRVMHFLEGLEQAAASGAPRLVLGIDPWNRELFVRLYEKFRAKPTTDEISRLQLLRELAGEAAGEANAPALVAIWTALHRAARDVSGIANGGALLAMGTVHQRWLTRPLLPFPEELTTEERAYFRRFQFQARGDAEADDLLNFQGSRVIEGWSSRRVFDRILRRSEDELKLCRRELRAIRAAGVPAGSSFDPALLDARIETLLLLYNTARHAVGYQTQLDRVRALGLRPEANPPNGQEVSWDRLNMLQTARNEIDNTVALLRRLRENPARLLHLAPTPAEEEITLLSPDLPAQLRRKIDLMEARWTDYDRIFTAPHSSVHPRR